MEETIKVGLFTEEIRIPWRELFSALILVIGVIGLYKCAADIETGLYATDMNTQSAVISLPVSDAKAKPGRDILDLTDAVTWNLPEIAKTEKEIALPVTEEVTAQAADTDVIASAVLHVTGYANGGLPEIVEYTGDFSDFSSDDLAVPSRLGKLFDGWYEDENVAALKNKYEKLINSGMSKGCAIDNMISKYPFFNPDSVRAVLD